MAFWGGDLICFPPTLTPHHSPCRCSSHTTIPARTAAPSHPDPIITQYHQRPAMGPVLGEKHTSSPSLPCFNPLQFGVHVMGTVTSVPPPPHPASCKVAWRGAEKQKKPPKSCLPHLAEAMSSSSAPLHPVLHLGGGLGGSWLEGRAQNEALGCSKPQLLLGCSPLAEALELGKKGERAKALQVAVSSGKFSLQHTTLLVSERFGERNLLVQLLCPLAEVDSKHPRGK